MKKITLKKNYGFTLIELMITVAVIAILARVAMPSYQNYVIRGNIPEATTGLSQIRSKAEQYFADNRNFTNFTCPQPDTVKNFTFSCPTLTASTYIIQASGNSSGMMANFVYTINQSGTKTSNTPWGSNTNCWVNNKSGGC